MQVKHNTTRKQRRALRVRGKLFGTSTKPRVSVHRTNKHIYVQAIDDGKRTTLASANDKQVKKAKVKQTAQAELVGKLLAKKLKAKKIKQVVFDRGAFRYHGRVKAIAEALRAEGVKL